MKAILSRCVPALILFALGSLFSGSEAAEPTNKIRLLLVTGGHDFEQEPFFRMFKENGEIQFTPVQHPQAHAYLRPDQAQKFDVLVLYDMWQDITDSGKADLLRWVEQGKGILSLHHSLANYQQWPEYARIIGGRYNLEKRMEGGSEQPQSTYKHDVRFRVSVVDPAHPVTQGLKDFEILDETYGLFQVRPGVQPLLTTEEPTSARTIGWAHVYGKARVVYVQLGHDHQAYENPNYRRLVAQAVRWCAKVN